MNKSTITLICGAVGLVIGGAAYFISKKSKAGVKTEPAPMNDDGTEPTECPTQNETQTYSSEVADIDTNIPQFDMSSATVIIPPTDIERLVLSQEIKDKIDQLNEKLKNALEDDVSSVSIIEIEKALDDSDEGEIQTPNGIRITRYSKRKRGK